MSDTTEQFVAHFRGTGRQLDGSDRARLEDEDFREAVYRAILQADTSVDRPLVIQLLHEEMRDHDTEEGGFSESLLFCAVLLALKAVVSDSVLLWRAKSINFDTFCGLDVQLLVGAGLEETVAFLRQQGSDEARAALEYIEQCRATSDFDNLAERYQAYRNRLA